MKIFPDISKLAAASEEDILLIWEGLGYYRRAINILKTAKIIKNGFNGLIPNDVNLLKSFPGIGNYTANAIASIAFNMDIPVIDGNIRRVISRVFNIDNQIGLPSTETQIKDFLFRLKPPNNVGDFNQALMDLGAMVCKSKNPDCQVCPLSKLCISYALNNQYERPVSKKKLKIPTYLYVCAVIKDSDKYLVVNRKGEMLLGGLWEFPNERLPGKDIEKEKFLSSICLNKYRIGIRIGRRLGIFKHTYTHFKQEMFVYHCELANQFEHEEKVKWTSLKDISNYPMGRISRKIIKTLGEN